MRRTKWSSVHPARVDQSAELRAIHDALKFIVVGDLDKSQPPHWRQLMGMLLEEQMSCWKMQKQINKLDVLLKFLLGQTGATGVGGGVEGSKNCEVFTFYQELASGVIRHIKLSFIVLSIKILAKMRQNINKKLPVNIWL